MVPTSLPMLNLSKPGTPSVSLRTGQGEDDEVDSHTSDEAELNERVVRDVFGPSGWIAVRECSFG